MPWVVAEHAQRRSALRCSPFGSCVYKNGARAVRD
jgi:hypothetical protein